MPAPRSMWHHVLAPPPPRLALWPARLPRVVDLIHERPRAVLGAAQDAVRPWLGDPLPLIGRATGVWTTDAGHCGRARQFQPRAGKTSTIVGYRDHRWA